MRPVPAPAVVDVSPEAAVFGDPAEVDTTRPAATSRRRLRAVPAAVVVGSGAHLVLAWGLVTGVVAAVLPLVLVVLTPTSTGLARRVALNGTVLLAWAPILWWLPLPRHPDHGALLVGAWAAGLTAWVAIAPASRLRALVPALGPSGALVAAAVGATVLATRAWLFVGSPAETLARLLPGYDNAAHFDIFSRMLQHGAMLDTLGPPPDGSSWSLQHYPQGFHAVAATFGQLLEPGVSRGPGAVVVYAHSVGLVVVLGAAVVVAALACLPAVQDRALVAAPAVTTVCALFVWGPGLGSIVDGFANFWLAGIAGAGALLLCLDGGRTPVLRWLGVLSALVVVANAWAPLLVVCGPAALASLLVGGRRSVPSDARGRALWAVVVLAAGAGGLRAAWMLLQVAHEDALHVVITAAGGITRPSPLPSVLLVPSALVLFLAFGRWVSAGLLPPPRRQRLRMPIVVAGRVARRLVIAVGAAAASLTVLLLLQLRAVHSVSYYFLKYLLGCELVLGPAAVGVAAIWAASALPPSADPRRRLPVVLLVCAAGTQCWGPVGGAALLGRAPVWDHRDPSGRPLRAAAVARDLLGASSVDRETATTSEYLALPGSAGSGSVLPATWFRALDGRLTTRAQERLARFAKPVQHPVEAAGLVAALLRRDPSVRVVVAPAYVAAIRAGVGDPALARRVTTWRLSTSSG